MNTWPGAKQDSKMWRYRHLYLVTETSESVFSGGKQLVTAAPSHAVSQHTKGSMWRQGHESGDRDRDRYRRQETGSGGSNMRQGQTSGDSKKLRGDREW